MTSFSSKRAQRDAKKPRSFIVPSGNGDKELRSGPEESISSELYNTLPPYLEIRRDEFKGRGIWTKQAFRRGSVLVTHRPHVSVLSTKNLPSHCSFCTTTSKNEDSLKRCTKCRTIWYCSPTCQKADWSLHKPECAAIQRWMSSAPDGSPPGEAVRSLGRMLWGRTVLGETSPWWREIQALQSHRSSLPPSAVETHTQLAHALVRYLNVTSPAELAPYGLHSSADIVDLISRFTTNTFTLASPTLSPLGTCVSPIAALFNHSCLPNAVIVFPHASKSPLQEPVLTVVALKDLAAGEEVLTAYIDTSLPACQRTQALRETYSFTCTCALCSGPALDPREAVWCPKACGGMCPAPFGDEQKTAPLPRCAACGTALAPPALHDVEDKRRIGQEALEKATLLQYSDPARARTLTAHTVALLERAQPPSAHPLLALLRLHQSLLIAALGAAGDGRALAAAVRAAARVVSALASVFEEGHPVRGVALAELGKLLAVDEPEPEPEPAPAAPAPGPSSASASTPAQSSDFPPTGAARLALAVDTLKRALRELTIGFGEPTQGGELGRDLRDVIINLERELDVWSRGVRNAWRDVCPGTWR